ncbi:MAG TPA: hypothetical protein VHF51_09340 [Solirubrobacteraceae bacterium]|nr:hypothetical protein [Solirubrobacteraceae bacterium]
MTPIRTDRDRLALAFAELNRHGVLARDGLAATAHEGHVLLRRYLVRRYPHGMGSYVFSQADDDRFDADGALISVLPLHCSAYNVAVAVAAACRNAGLVADPDGRATILRLAPAHAR